MKWIASVDWSAVFAKFITFLSPVVHSVAATVVTDDSITNPYIKAVALGISGLQARASSVAAQHLKDVAVDNAATPNPVTPTALPPRASDG